MGRFYEPRGRQAYVRVNNENADDPQGNPTPVSLMVRMDAPTFGACVEVLFSKEEAAELAERLREAVDAVEADVIEAAPSR
jgi:hypothetical protein